MKTLYRLAYARVFNFVAKREPDSREGPFASVATFTILQMLMFFILFALLTLFYEVPDGVMKLLGGGRFAAAEMAVLAINWLALGRGDSAREIARIHQRYLEHSPGTLRIVDACLLSVPAIAIALAWFIALQQ